MVLFGRNKEKLGALKALAPDKVHIEAVDLTKSVCVESLALEVKNKLGIPSILINCAGSGLFGKITDLNYQDIEQTLSNNLLTVINPCKAFFEPMKQAGGTIVNIMSTAALKGKAGESIYCAAKWGVRGFTESLREEAKGSKLRIVSVYPAGMNTPFWESSDVDYPTETFMFAEDAAIMIVNALSQAEKGFISEITLSR